MDAIINVPLCSHKSPALCLICYLALLLYIQITIIQCVINRYKESPPLLFTLAPDDKYIRYTMEKAMYLVDETGLAQYNTLKEKGFYSNILGTSAVFSIFCDSISFDKKNMEFTYYGRQRIERRSNILMRELVTAGQLKRVPRTDNNPHGLLIVNWRTLLNKDIEQKTKSNY